MGRAARYVSYNEQHQLPSTATATATTTISPYPENEQARLEDPAREALSCSVLLRLTHTPAIMPFRALHNIPAKPYDWPITSLVRRENTALVIIDMQVDCTCHHHDENPQPRATEALGH
jgi:hypothetical protein